MGILWTIIIGFVAGLIAKFLHPGPNEPTGFILTTILGIVGAFLAPRLPCTNLLVGRGRCRKCSHNAEDSCQNKPCRLVRSRM